jgi:hypothetical protein
MLRIAPFFTPDTTTHSVDANGAVVIAATALA